MLATALLAALSLYPSGPTLRSRTPCVALRSRVQRARVPLADMAFASRDEYDAHLAADAALPEGFRVGVSGFGFTPAEADIDAIMNMTLIVLDQPTKSFAATFTRNAFCGSPVTVGKQRMRDSPEELVFLHEDENGAVRTLWLPRRLAD